MIRTWVLTAAAISGFTIALAIAEEALAQQTLTERHVTLVGTARDGEPRAERRIALVVGNSNYEAKGISLTNPKNDATDVGQALQRLGFEVLTAIDANKRTFETKVADFARMGENADVALFFYAGHAMQLEGENYLMPVDAELKDGDSIWSMVRLDDVRRALDRVSRLKVMILDACRNNPLSDPLYRSAGGGGHPRGLARIDKTQGMIAVYATAAGEVAEDGKGHNSPFTGALLTRMDEAGLEITRMLRLVGADVSTQTEGRQRPEITVQSYKDYFLNQSDHTAWQKIKDSADPSALRDFIQKFPSSLYYPVAVDRLARLAPPVPPQPVPHDRSAATPGAVMTPRAAQQPVQPAGPLPADHAANLKLDVVAHTTASDRPGKTEAVPNTGPRIELAGHRLDKISAVADRASVQSTLKTETEIIGSLAPFADGNPVVRARPPRSVDTDRGRVRVDYNRAIDITVFFDSDSARLTEEASAQLEPLGRALQSRELMPYRFLIASHTDVSGDPAYNRSLSLKRVATVRAYLSQTYGVDPLRLVIHGWGRSLLKDPANPFSGGNRRVEIALIMPDTSAGEDYQGFGTREFAADIVPGRRLLVDENGTYGRIVNAPDVAQLREVACRRAATGVGGQLLSDPRRRLSRLALDDFGTTPTAPCRFHGANMNIRFETGGPGVNHAASTYTFPLDHGFGRRGGDAD